MKLALKADRSMERGLQFTDQSMFLPREGKLKWEPKVKPIVAARCDPQLRLFVMELAFLSLVLPRISSQLLHKPDVLYVGAAMGRHIPHLASLFPELNFFLYDVHRCCFPSAKKLTVIQHRFTDQTAAEWRDRGRSLIFISDIRDQETDRMTGKQYEESIGVNMQDQARWSQILAPVLIASSLKFRIPYPIVEKGEIFMYLPGSLMLQPFTKSLSMEMRLISTKSQVQEGMVARYNSRNLEQLIFYHNMKIRPDKKLFSNIYSQDEKKYDDRAFDHGYDMTYMLHVIDNYLMSPHAVRFEGLSFTEEDNIKLVKKLIADI